MSYEFFFQIVHLYRYVTKGNINGIFEKIDVFGVMWFILHMQTSNSQKKSPVLILLKIFLK